MSLLSPELLSEIDQVVASGHEVARKKPSEPLCGRINSFVAKTDVGYPTDIGLLRGATFEEKRLNLQALRPAEQCQNFNFVLAQLNYRDEIALPLLM